MAGHGSSWGWQVTVVAGMAVAGMAGHGSSWGWQVAAVAGDGRSWQ